MEKLNFPTQYSKHERFFMVTGDEYEPTFAMKVDDFGVKDLVQVGVTNRYEYVQSWKDSVDINVILDRFTRGDVSALSKKQPLYGDFSDMPRSLSDLQNIFLDAERDFYSLPLSERAKFNHSYDQYLASVLSPHVNVSPVAAASAAAAVPAADAAPAAPES